MKTIADTLGVSRSNLYEKRQEEQGAPRGHYRKARHSAAPDPGDRRRPGDVWLPPHHSSAQPPLAGTGPFPGQPEAGLPDHEREQSAPPQAHGQACADARRADRHASKQYALVFGYLRDRLLERGTCPCGVQHGLLRPGSDLLRGLYRRHLGGDGEGPDGREHRSPVRPGGSRSS